jgi:hypothetical protein
MAHLQATRDCYVPQMMPETLRATENSVVMSDCVMVVLVGVADREDGRREDLALTEPEGPSRSYNSGSNHHARRNAPPSVWSFRLSQMCLSIGGSTHEESTAEGFATPSVHVFGPETKRRQVARYWRS